MARRKIKEEVTRTWERTIMTCDLCGLETKPGERGLALFEQLRDLYRLDVCPPCFMGKFMPGVEKLFGVKFTKTDSETS
jgi:hypothetical protein